MHGAKFSFVSLLKKVSKKQRTPPGRKQPSDCLRWYILLLKKAVKVVVSENVIILNFNS